MLGSIQLNMVWHIRVSHNIYQIGYDISTETLVIIFTDRSKKYYRPVPYSLYTKFVHAPFPDRFYRHTIEEKIPVIIPA